MTQNEEARALPQADWQWLADQLRAWPEKRVHPERTMCEGTLRPMAAAVIEEALRLLAFSRSTDKPDGGGEVEPPMDFPYQRTFDAIGAAVEKNAIGIGISVQRFQDAWNKGATPAPDAGNLGCCPSCGTWDVHSEGCQNGPCYECGRQGERYVAATTTPAPVVRGEGEVERLRTLLKRIEMTLGGIADGLSDEGGRVYLNCTEDADTMRALAADVTDSVEMILYEESVDDRD